MDRLHINSFTPAEIAERIADQPGPRISSSDRQYARDDLLTRLLDGKRVDGMDLGGLIDCAYDADMKAVATKLHFFFAGIEQKGKDQTLLLAFDMGQWARGLAEKWIDSRPDLIDERAAEVAAWDE